MSTVVEVKSDNTAVKAQRQAVARRVLTYFGDSLPASRVLCFLDDGDWRPFKEKYGAANRGGYQPLRDDTPLAEWPNYVRNCTHVKHDAFPFVRRVVDDLIYLHGSTCASEAGLIMTLAHEMQHAIQHSKAQELWAANSLVSELDRAVIDALKLTWADIPIEREARIVSKRAAVHLLGEQPVLQYIDKKIAERITEDDAADWQFVRTLTLSSSIDLVESTQLLFRRLRGYRAELEEVLQEKKNDPDFSDIDLGTFLDGAQR